MAGHDAVIHLASNPDIARGDDRARRRLRRGHAAHPPRGRGDAAAPASAGSPTRRAAASTATSASSRRTRTTGRSCRSRPTARASSPARRSSPRTRTCSTCTGRVFRFGNVVGPRQTHGVGFDFVRRLLDDPTRLTILGRRHAEQVVCPRRRTSSPPCCSRMRRRSTEPFARSTSRPATTSRCARSPSWPSSASGSTRARSRYEYTGGDRGWKGDVPVVRLATERDPRARLGADAAARARRCARRWRRMLDDVRASAEL